MAKLLIEGASHGIGLEAVKQALARGYTVRAFARSAGRIGISHPNLEKCAGDALDPVGVTSALQGVDAVVQALGIAPGLRMAVGPVTLFSTATRILVSAMRGLKVKRLICVTGFGAGDSRERIGCFASIPFRLFLARAYQDKDVQERIVEDSGLSSGPSCDRRCCRPRATHAESPHEKYPHEELRHEGRANEEHCRE